MTNRTDARDVPEPAAWADLLTIPQAAVRLGISRPTVYRMISDGRLPRVHVGAARRIPAQAIDDFLVEIGAAQAAADRRAAS